MKMLTGFLAPCAGTASIFGFDIRNRTLQAQRLIGYLPGRFALLRGNDRAGLPR